MSETARITGRSERDAAQRAASRSPALFSTRRIHRALPVLLESPDDVHGPHGSHTPLHGVGGIVAPQRRERHLGCTGPRQEGFYSLPFHGLLQLHHILPRSADAHPANKSTERFTAQFDGLPKALDAAHRSHRTDTPFHGMGGACAAPLPGATPVAFRAATTAPLLSAVPWIFCSHICRSWKQSTAAATGRDGTIGQTNVANLVKDREVVFD